jgi:hypothetical protein
MLLAVLVLASAVLAPPAQDRSDLRRQFMDSYRGMLKVADLKGIARLAGKDHQLTEEVVAEMSYEFARTGELKVLEEANPLVDAADVADNGKRYRTRFNLLAVLTPDDRKKWLDLVNANSKVLTEFAEAHQKKEMLGYNRVMTELEEVGKQAVALKDLEIASFLHYHVGICHEQLGEYRKVIATFGETMDEWLAGGRPKDNYYEYMKVKRAELIEKGYENNDHPEGATPNPDKPGGDKGAGTTGNGTTSFKPGTDFQTWETTYREMKDVGQFESLSPWNADYPLLWREFTFDTGSKPFGLLVQAQPFGKAMNVVREGSHAFFDCDGDAKGDVPIKVIDGKPTLNVAKFGKGKEQENYAFWMLTGGEHAQWFSESNQNYTTRGQYRIGCYRETKIAGETVVLIDDNCSGVLGDPSERKDNVLRGEPAWIDDDEIVVGKGRAIPYSDVVELGGKWYSLKLEDPKGRKVRTHELAIQTGQVVLKWNGPVAPRSLVLGETHDFKGCFFDVAGGKPVTVPAGHYEIAIGRIETGKLAQTRQAWIFKGDAKEVEVKPGETTTLDMGGPYTLDVQHEDAGKTFVVKGKSLIVHDKSGAIVGRIYDEVLYPELQARVKGGSSFGKPQTMQRPATEVLNKDFQAPWFPGDVVIQKPEKTELEVKLELKKHALLGGPFTSDWK